MDYKLPALLLVVMAVAFEVSGAFSPVAARAAFMQAGSFRAVHKAAAAVHRLKRAAGQQDVKDNGDPGATDKPGSKQKQPVITGSVIVVGVLSGVAALLCVLALGWSIYMFTYRKEDVGATSS